MQLIRFGIVGACAASVNMLIVACLVEKFNVYPLIANIFAFAIAFNFSYVGHRYWSFAGTMVKHKSALPRFLLIAIISFILNEGLFYVFLRLFALYYLIALLLVLLIVPFFTFFCSKLWAFKK
jgi:putative flippase GtrA